MTSPVGSVILFDGVCNLCNGFVQFVIARDPARRFHFASLQSDAARRLVDAHGDARAVAFAASAETLILIEAGQVFTRSAAALRVARRLRFPWPLAYGLIVIPRPIRDGVYRVVARHRYRWFGKRETCLVPTPELRDRFL